MAPQKLKIYILHDVCVVSMISVFPRSKTVYLVISKNRPISRSKKKIIKGDKNMKFIEVELQGTSEAEFLYFAWSISSEYGFDTLKV